MGSKNIWIVLTITIIWLVVLITSLSAPEMSFGDDPVVLRPGAILNWFWGLLATVFVLRSTVFRRQEEMGWGDTDAWPWLTVVVGAIWLVTLIAGAAAPDVVINENIIIPVASIAAPPIAAGLTLFSCEFLITGFAARKPLDAA